jgi:adenylate kinase family enzyme
MIFGELVKEQKKLGKLLKENVKSGEKVNKNACVIKLLKEKVNKKACVNCGFCKEPKVEEPIDIKFKCQLCNLTFADKEMLKTHKADEEHNKRLNVKNNIHSFKLPELNKIEDMIY